MKKLLTLLFAGMLIISCTDYDSKFDALNAQIEELMAANEALEAQVIGLAAAQAQIAQATALQLQGFQAQVATIAELLQTVSDSNVELESLIDTLTAQIEAITTEVAAVAESIEASDAANAEANDALKALLDSITDSLADVQAQLDEIEVVVEAIHHSGGGSHTSGGSADHHSGGGSHTSGGSADHHSGGGSTTDSGTEEHTSGGSTADSGTEEHSSGGSSDDSSSQTETQATDNGDENLDLYVTVPPQTTSVRIVGPWWGNWDPGAGPVGTDLGNGVFKFTFTPAPEVDMEYKYLIDGAQEDITDNAGDGECTERIDAGMMNTDYWSYGNRIWILGSGDQAETAGECSIDTIE